MGKRKRNKKKQEEVEVIPESPASPDSADVSIENTEKPSVLATQPTIEIEESIEEHVIEIPEPEDPRYTILKDSIINLLKASPKFRLVSENPWLYLEWRSQLANLVEYKCLKD